MENDKKSFSYNLQIDDRKILNTKGSVFTIGLFNESFKTIIKNYLEEEENSTAMEEKKEKYTTPKKSILTLNKNKIFDSPKPMQKERRKSIFGRKNSGEIGQRYLQQTMQNLQLIREIPDDITSLSVTGNIMGAVNASGELYMTAGENVDPICIGRMNANKKIGIDYVGLENNIKMLKWDFERNTIIETEQKYSNSAFGVFTILRVNDNNNSSVNLVSVGNSHSVASTSDNTIYSWGENVKNTSWVLGKSTDRAEKINEKPYDKNGEAISGQLGNMDVKESLPIKMEGIDKNEKILSLACGENHTAVLTENGIYSCGNNSNGQLGRSGPNTPLSKIKFNIKIIKVSCGGMHSAAIAYNGDLFCWGSNLYGQLGLGQDKIIVGTPKIVHHIKAKDVSCGKYHTSVITNIFKLETFGANKYGQCGGGSLENIYEPFTVEMPGVTLIYIQTGDYSTIVSSDGGDVYMMGFLLNANHSYHQYTPRRIEEIRKNHFFVTRVGIGILNLAFLCDKRLTLLTKELVKFCSFEKYNRSLKNKLIKAPQQTKAIQNRVIRWLHEESKGYLPLISLDNTSISFVCDNNAKFPFSKSTFLTVTNEGDDMLDFEIQINESELFQSSSYEIIVTPQFFKLERGESGRINFTCNCFKPLMGSIESMFHLEAKKKLKKRNKNENLEYRKVRSVIMCTVFPVQKMNLSSKMGIDNSIVDTLSSYVPNFVRRHIKDNNQVRKEPYLQRISASILFIDISGFTSLNEQLAKLGSAGPEAVSKHINNYFTQIIDVVYKFGGDILKFAGDALICLFIPENERRFSTNDNSEFRRRTFTKNKHLTELNVKSYHSSMEFPKNLSGHDIVKSLTSDTLSEITNKTNYESDELNTDRSYYDESSLPDVSLRAVQCGTEIQTKYPEYDSGEGFKLMLHIGIGSGNLNAIHVGGVDGFWEFLVVGDPIKQLETAVHNSNSREVVVSSFCYNLIKNKVSAKEIPAEINYSPTPPIPKKEKSNVSKFFQVNKVEDSKIDIEIPHKNKTEKENNNIVQDANGVNLESKNVSFKEEEKPKNPKVESLKNDEKNIQQQ
eukprot:TRINITY_DN8451_c0_g2_i1.p1 TRINITY_DN8451_c0_g2~~TRINITY_DN8451_c0_g2_i1.p1  ORF type:complete len:1067 (+),score=301.28 TRINITY_DN8451_c0_g2_i1:263-3463(+)